MPRRFSRREFLKTAWHGANYLTWGRHLRLRPPESLGPLRSGADLDLTHFWDGNVYELTPDRGRARISASLFIGKFTQFNYGFQQPGTIPGDVSTLEWNSAEAIFEFGTHVLAPGDEIVFIDNTDPSDRLTEEEFGAAGEHGDGYYRIGNGMCNSATTLGEAFGIEVLVEGVYVPLFIARPGSIQPHNLPHNPAYYEYSYNGEGVAVSPTLPDGKLPFAVNPNLPAGVLVSLGLSVTDTIPDEPHKGFYKPTVTVEVTGLPRGSKLRYQRLTANRTETLRRVMGTKNFMSKRSQSNYFDENGEMIISRRPILPPNPSDPAEVVRVTTLAAATFESYLGSSAVPLSMRNERVYPGGFARGGEHLPDGTVIWDRSDDWLPISPDDLPSPMRSISAEELMRILLWNNVGDPENVRYQATNRYTYCNVAAVDWAAAYRVRGYPHAAPLPRWVMMREQKLTTNDLYDWFTFGEASVLGWHEISATEAQGLANEGLLVFAIVRNYIKWPGHMTVIVPGDGETVGGVFYPNVADGGRSFGPEEGKTALDSFEHTFIEGYSPISYFVWVPPDLD